MPTILDFLDLPTVVEQQYRAPGKDLFPQDVVAASKTVDIEGESLLPLMSGAKNVIREFYGRAWAIRTKEWSFHLNLSTGERALFDLREDPGERRNLVAENPAVARDLELELRRHADQVMRRGARAQ